MPWGALPFFSFYFVVCCCFLVKFRKPLWRAVCCVFHLISHSPLQTESASELEHCSMSWLQLSTKLSSWALSQVTPRKRDSCPTNVPTSCVIGEKITVRKGINSWNTRKYVQKVSIRSCERSVLKVHRVYTGLMYRQKARLCIQYILSWNVGYQFMGLYRHMYSMFQPTVHVISVQHRHVIWAGSKPRSANRLSEHLWVYKSTMSGCIKSENEGNDYTVFKCRIFIVWVVVWF